MKEAIGTLANRREANGFPPWRKPTKHTHEKDKKKFSYDRSILGLDASIQL